MKRGLLIATTIGLLPAVDAGAVEPAAGADRRLFIGPNVSTLGIGGEVGYRLNDYVTLRGGGNAFGYEYDDEIDGVDYDIDLGLASAGLTLDVHPFRGGFHLSAGVRWNGNDADLDGRAADPVTIDGTTYAPDEIGRLTGEAEFASVAPYLGLGYTFALLDGRLSLALDAGVYYQGDPDVDLEATGPAASDPAVQAELEEQREEVEDALEYLQFYPVATIALRYHF
jgi:hypothetical protein